MVPSEQSGTGDGTTTTTTTSTTEDKKINNNDNNSINNNNNDNDNGLEDYLIETQPEDEEEVKDVSDHESPRYDSEDEDLETYRRNLERLRTTYGAQNGFKIFFSDCESFPIDDDCERLD